MVVDVISIERFGVDSVVPFVGTIIVLGPSVSQSTIIGLGEVGGCSVINWSWLKLAGLVLLSATWLSIIIGEREASGWLSLSSVDLITLMLRE